MKPSALLIGEHLGARRILDGGDDERVALAAGPRGVVAAGDPQAMANAPRETFDLRVSLARQRHAFVVTAIEDATGAEVFAYQQGSGFHRRTATPSFARAVHKAGYGEALASVLR